MNGKSCKKWTQRVLILGGAILMCGAFAGQANALICPTASPQYYSGRGGQAVSYAEANLKNAEAAKAWEEARARALENESARVRTFFEKRDINDRAREAERFRRQNAKVEALIERTKMLKQYEQTLPEYHKALDAVREAKLDRAREEAVRFGPGRPTVDELDRSSGRIDWPTGLMNDNYRVHRMTLDELFAERCQGVGDRGELDYEIQEAVKRMQADMKRHIRKMSPSHYGSAKTFLNRLSYETRFDPLPQRIRQVAGR